MSGGATPPRAGILVTGTEVLTGIISDRNGPWLSERLREIGVDAAMIQIVGDRPDDLMATLEFMRDAGMALIITSGGLGPTADDLTAEIVGRFCGSRDGARRAAGGADRRDPAAADGALARPRPRVRARVQSQAGGHPGGRDDPRARGHRPGARRPAARRRRPDRGRAARAAPRASADVGDGPPDRGLCRGDHRRRRVPAGDRAVVRDPGVRDRQHPAGGRGGGTGPGCRWRSPRACGGARSRLSTQFEPDGQAAYDAFLDFIRRAPRRHALLRGRLDDRRSARRAAGRAYARRRGVLHRGAASRGGSPTAPGPRPISWGEGWSTPTRPRSTWRASTPS